MKYFAITLGLAFALLIPFSGRVLAADSTASQPPVESFFSLYPPCLSTADAAQGAGVDCISETIWFYVGKLLIVIAIGAFFYVLYGAFLYVSAFGDEAKVKQGRTTITNALIGVVIAVLAYFIVALIHSTLKVGGSLPVPPA